jgi:predicted RNase H-like HicB family nuclease
MARYLAIVDGTPGAYGVVVPDLPGCTSGGPTVDKALRNAVGAVILWMEDARADGEKIPKPRAAGKLRNEPDVTAALAEGGVLAYVPLVLDTARRGGSAASIGMRRPTT